MFYCYFNRKGPLEYVYLGQVELLIVATGPMFLKWVVVVEHEWAAGELNGANGSVAGVQVS